MLNGFGVALAWPETWCKQPGSWYDGLMGFLGFSRQHYYRAGHAALVLVNPSTLECHYFDFGRYHAPFGYGRARGAVSDHELRMKTRAVVSQDGKDLLNLSEILDELQNNKGCHGDGILHASSCGINFEKAMQSANDFQKRSPIAYGPFVLKGSNCSRFVYSVLLAGKPAWKTRIRLLLQKPLTPTPMSNVKAMPVKGYMKKPSLRPFVFNVNPAVLDQLQTTLPMPLRAKNIPEAAMWLSGEGAGSWFHIVPHHEGLYLHRYSPEGDLECSGFFIPEKQAVFDLNAPFQLDYPSHCNQLKVQQKGEFIHFIRASDVVKTNIHQI